MDEYIPYTLRPDIYQPLEQQCSITPFPLKAPNVLLIPLDGSLQRSLTCRRLHLRCRSLSTLLALNTLCLSRCRLGRRLSLLLLLLALRRCLLLLPFLDRLGASSAAGLWSLGTALFDDVEGGADDGALVFDCAARALLCDFLYRPEMSAIAWA
jgi:hypothetical protein